MVTTNLFSSPNPEFQPEAVPVSEDNVCRECGGRGLLILDDGSAKRCRCTLVDSYQQRLQAARIPKKYMSRTFESFDLKAVPSSFLPMINDIRGYAITFQDIAKLEKKGLLMTGGVGSGKTHLAVSVLHQIIADGSTGLFWNTVDFFQALRATMDANSEISEDDLLNQARSADLLVLDDLGTERTSEWVLDRLYMLINSRYQDDMPIIVTTNQNHQELSDRVGQRIVSRLFEMGQLVKFPSGDYRRRHLDGKVSRKS